MVDVVTPDNALWSVCVPLELRESGFNPKSGSTATANTQE